MAMEVIATTVLMIVEYVIECDQQCMMVHTDVTVKSMYVMELEVSSKQG